MTHHDPKVLVTGGAGFIGANLVRTLLQHDFQVSVLDNLSTGRREHLQGLPVTLIQGDILDVRAVNDAVAENNYIVHLAAQTGVPGSLADPRRDCETNVIGTLNMLEACRHQWCQRTDTDRSTRKFVLASSNAPLGRQPAPASEDKAALPIAPYGASKLAAEGYCLAYHGSWQLSTIVLRFGNVYGPFSAHKDSVVAKFFKDIRADGRLMVNGDGHQTRDFIYVEDLCRAVLLALRSNVSGEVFQIATGEETSILDLASLVQEAAGVDACIEHGPARKGDIRTNYSAIAKVRRVLGWLPEIQLRDGLHQSWTWFDSYFAKHRS